jgi:hypothetical protein
LQKFFTAFLKKYLCVEAPVLSVRFVVVLLLLLPRPLAGFAQDQIPVVRPENSATCSLFGPAPIGDSNLNGDGFQIRLLAIYNAQARLVRSMKAVAIIHATRGPKFGDKAGTSRPITGFFSFDQPALLRVTGVVPPMGKRAFDLSSDGREYQLLAPDHDIVKRYIGLVDAPPDMSAIKVPEISDIARPREILDALRWQEGSLRKLPAASAKGNQALEFDLPPRAGKSISGKLLFDANTGAITSLQIYGADGELISELFYADWQPVTDSAASPSQGCFPRRVRLVQPMEDVQLDFRFLELTLNPRIPRAGFRLSPPPGTPVVRLSAAGADKNH